MLNVFYDLKGTYAVLPFHLIPMSTLSSLFWVLLGKPQFGREREEFLKWSSNLFGKIPCDYLHNDLWKAWTSFVIFGDHVDPFWFFFFVLFFKRISLSQFRWFWWRWWTPRPNSMIFEVCLIGFFAFFFWSLKAETVKPAIRIVLETVSLGWFWQGETQFRLHLSLSCLVLLERLASL